MINVKLLVLFVIFGITECQNYCEICPSHTLCLYKNPGPSPSCTSYDKAATLTKEDARTIIDKINQRRNFVALGLAKNLPSAANMNKVVWSDELATFAQRWVDQCDVAARPAVEDICRDLADSSVGQNIATIVGISPGLKVKSFVEMWFMESLYYTGSVTYFNQSEESKTNYFTQLIWADTKYVGCGKARFSIDDKGTMIDRLVCNFAPKGNILGKPIYTIGYPATQCNENSRRDETFSGLCNMQEVTTLNTSSTASVSSLLRIVNLPNGSEHDIDLLRNYKHLETDNDLTNVVRHQQMRHITNNSHFLRHELEPDPILHEETNIPARHNVIPFQHTISHSQNVHGAVYRTRSPNDEFIRHDNMESIRKHYISRQCTRKSGFDNTRNHYNNQNENNQCTRRLKGNEYILTTTPKKTTISYGPICECNSQKTTSHITTQFTCDVNCCCLNTNNCATVDLRRQLAGQIANYDNIPDTKVHTKDEINKRQFLRYLADSSTHVATPMVKDEEDSNADYSTTKTKTFYFNKIKSQRQYSERLNSQRKPTNVYHLINPFGRRKRLKRQIENPSAYKSLWQNDDYDMQPELKSLRYTTLSDRRRKFRTKQRMRYDTEPITIKSKDVSLPEHDVTEKFLSFDELMHLRRNYGKDSGFDARRDAKKKTTTKAKPKTAATKATSATTKAKSAATKATSATTKAKSAATKAPTTIPTTKTTVATLPIVNTPVYKPLKHCTRKVTCTWTAPTVTGKDGQVFTKGRGISRTPPGYVEGCSRTSTCTREYMNRNKQPNTADSTEVTNPDEDYCERRSLDLQPRNPQDDALEKIIDQTDFSRENEYDTSFKDESTTISQEDCTCDNQEVRKKRSILHKRPKSEEDKSKERPLTYDDLYLVILGKILRLMGYTNIKNKSNVCFWNKSNSLYLYNHYYLFTFLLLYMY